MPVKQIVAGLLAAAFLANCFLVSPLPGPDAEIKHSPALQNDAPALGDANADLACNAEFFKAAEVLRKAGRQMVFADYNIREVWAIIDPDGELLQTALATFADNHFRILRFASLAENRDQVLKLAERVRDANAVVIVDNHCVSSCVHMLILPKAYVCEGTIVGLRGNDIDAFTSRFVFGDEGHPGAEHLLKAMLEAKGSAKDAYTALSYCLKQKVRPLEELADLGEAAPVTEARGQPMSELAEWWVPSLDELRRIGVPFEIIDDPERAGQTEE